MRLLYFTIQINSLGGLARIVIDKANWLVAHGYEVTLCNIEPLAIHPYYPLDSRVRLLQGGMQTCPGGVMTRLKGTLGTVRRLRQILKEVSPDMVVNAHAPLVTWVLPFIARKVPKVMEIHQSRQGLEVFDAWAMGHFSRWLHRFMIRWIYGRYDRFVVLTHGDRECWHLSNCRVIPNFSNYVYSPQKSSALTSRKVIVLARLMPQKRLDLMIRIWAQIAPDFPDWELNVLGDGMCEPELRKMIAERGLERTFHLCGAVQNVEASLEEASVLCLTSEYEGFGIVLIEAMLKGVPVIAFEYVGVHDIIQHDVDGYVIPFGDVNKYAKALRGLLSSREERLRLRNNAFLSVKRFDREQVMQQWVDLFMELSHKSK